MPSANKSIKQQFREYLAGEPPARITESVWRDLLMRLAPVSESYLRELVRDTGLAFDQPYAGIRQHTLQDLEESLREMLQVFTEANASGNRELARYCRRQVIAAKDRAKFMVKRNPLKEEMVQWMLVWLENPEVFPAWVEARKKVADLEPRRDAEGHE